MDLSELKRLAGITPQSLSNFAQSNPSYTGSQLAKIQRENNIRPGTPEWFRLWFAKPYLTGETPIDNVLSEALNQPYSYSQPVRTSNHRVYQFDGKYPMFYTADARVRYEPETNQKLLVIGFQAKDLETGEETVERTDRHDSLRVFATVLDIMHREMKREKPDQLKFAAKLEDQKRVELYRSYLPQFISSYPGYRIGKETIETDQQGVQQNVFTAVKTENP